MPRASIDGQADSQAFDSKKKIKSGLFMISMQGYIESLVRILSLQSAHWAV